MPSIEKSLHDLDDCQISENNKKEGKDNIQRERFESKIRPERGIWEHPSQSKTDNAAEYEKFVSGTLDERNSFCSDDVDHERLCRERFHEPSGLKHSSGCVKDKKEHCKCNDIEQRTQGTECVHKFIDEFHNPSFRLLNPFFIDIIDGNGNL